MSNNNDMKSQTAERFEKVEQKGEIKMKKDFDGAVTASLPKIEELEGASHKLVEQMAAWRGEAAKINEERDLSGEGKAKRLSELKQKIDKEMTQLDSTFHRDFESLDGALAHLQNERNSDEPDLPESPEGLRLSGEKAIWKQNAQLERRIGNLESLLLNQHRQNLLKSEIETMDADTLVRKADWAWKVADKTSMEIFARFARQRLTQLGSVEAIASLGKILNDYEASLVPEHAKNAVKLRARLAKGRASWRTMFELVKGNLR